VGWASRIHAEQLSATWFGRTQRGRLIPKNRSTATKYWETPFAPGSMLLMSDRIYGIMSNGSLWRLPISEAKNVQAV
jgi:hypothetical protein